MLTFILPDMVPSKENFSCNVKGVVAEQKTPDIPSAICITCEGIGYTS